MCLVNLESYFKSGAWYNLKFDVILDRIFTLVIIVAISSNYSIVAFQVKKLLKIKHESKADYGEIKNSATEPETPASREKQQKSIEARIYLASRQDI